MKKVLDLAILALALLLAACGGGGDIGNEVDGHIALDTIPTGMVAQSATTKSGG